MSHGRGEVFTLDRIEADGRAISSSSILYLDGTSRDLQDFECSGTQSSRWLPDRASIYLLRVIAQDLLTPGGVLLFTNIAEGNPWRRLMEYGSDWDLIERSEVRILELCRAAGITGSCISLQREDTGLTLIARVVL